MSGFIQDPLQIINLIADNLRDRYKSGFPVLKEIIQNADDAGSLDQSNTDSTDTADQSIQLEFGLSDGVPTAQHPLLKGPGLYFLNNGNFTDKDDRAIRSFGLNSKASNPSSIGKFGLGMKSVFHFCEAFFFWARNREKDYAKILNPWSGNDEFPSRHADWDSLSVTDGKLIKMQLRAVFNAMNLERSSFFLLWLPLRKETHLHCTNGTVVGSIINEFPGDNPDLLSFLHKPELAQQLASLLPLLRRITQIRFWDNAPEPVFEVKLEPRSKRILRNLNEAYTARGIVGAAVCTIRGQKKKSSTMYTGQETLLNTPELRALKQSKLWPKTFVRNEKGESREAPDKAQGHCAAVFSISDGEGGGNFIINWAVFLPVGEKNNEKMECDGRKTFHLSLHGYFFVDAGRADIEGLQEKKGDLVKDINSPDSEAELRISWNRVLVQQGTLPLIIPSLDSFATKTRLSAEDRWHLAQGLVKSELFRQYREVICAKFSWVCRLTRKGKEWCKVPADQNMLALPKPPLSVPDRPWATFPQLESFENRNIILLQNDAPHLFQTAKSMQQWSVPDLLAILQFKEKHVFSDQGCLEYLLEFLHNGDVLPFLSREELQSCLKKTFRSAFSVLGFDLRKHRSIIQKFVSFILPEKRYPIKLDVSEIIQYLQNSLDSILIIADEFDSSEQPGNAQFSMEEAFILLQTLDKLIIHYDNKNKYTTDSLRVIAGDILKKQPEEQRHQLLRQASALKIVSGYDCTKGRELALSIYELQSSMANHLLFQYSQGTQLRQRLGLAPKLQETIQEPVIVIKSEIIDLIFGKKSQISSCSAEAALDALGKRARALQSVKQRQELLHDTAGADLSAPDRVRGLRYLLHGSSDHFDRMDSLWISGYEEENSVWVKIWQYLQRDTPNHWTLIDRQLAEGIASNKWSTLKIQEIKSKAILDELRRNGTEKLIDLSLNREERNTVLRELSYDEKLWRMLPFHETVQGKLVRIAPGKTYLASAIKLPDALIDNVDLIVPSDDEQIQKDQNKWIVSLATENVVKIILRHNDPAKFWSLMLDCIDEKFDYNKLTDEEQEQLKDTSWLIDKHNTPLKPEDVIYLETIQDEVNRLLVHARSSFYSPEDLLSGIRKHPHFSFLQRHCFAIDKNGFEKLALLLGETPEYRLGCLILPGNQDELNEIIQICVRFSINLQMHGWILLDKALKEAPQYSKELLLPELLKSIHPEKTVTILHWLQKEQEIAAIEEEKSALLKVFNCYLKSLVPEERRGHFLAKLMLLNGEGKWRLADELCVEAEGVATSHILDREQRQILNSALVDTKQASLNHTKKKQLEGELQAEVMASVNMLKKYFSDWKELVTDETICAFLTVLGGEPGLSQLAEEYRGKHTTDWIRKQIPWEIPRGFDMYNRNVWLADHTKEMAFASFIFIVELSKGDTVAVRSITGKQINVPKSDSFTSLFVGKPDYKPHDTQYIIRIGLRTPDFQHTSPSELSGFLRSAAEYLLKEVYNQKKTDLGSLWEELDRSDQLDIRIAQRLILDHLPFYLTQLKIVKKHGLLWKIHQKWEDASHKKVEYEDDENRKKECEVAERQALDEMQKLLEDDHDVQKIVLDAVREKIYDFQYRLESIPFELFQNADDAVVELSAIRSYPGHPGSVSGEDLSDREKRFVLLQKEKSLTFIHWGRRINEIGGFDFPGRKKGFHKDLEKMLTISSSDKSAEDGVTGKFGLGFKSVFLACDKPILVSGRLAVEIIAGLCPLPLQDSVAHRRQLSTLAPNQKRIGTLIELPLTEEKRPQEIIDPFLQNAGLLTIFSKLIRRIEKVVGQSSQIWEWLPISLSSAQPAALEYGAFQWQNDQKTSALYFRFAQEGGILVGIGPKGLETLPQAIPAIWVVTPMQEMNELGFAINGPFALDPGRSRLAGKGNTKACAALGQVFGQALMRLQANIQKDWGEVKEQFRLEADLTEYLFWWNLWKVFTKGISKAKETNNTVIYDFITHVLCVKNGLGCLISNADVMPNGLWGNYQRLTSPKHVRIVLKGSLAKENVFTKFAQWDFFQECLGTGTGVLTEEIFADAKIILPEFGRTTDQYHFIRVADVFKDFIKTSKEIPPATANLLGGMINTENLNSEQLVKEAEQINKSLREFLFLAMDGSFHKSNALLIATHHRHANPDEAKRAAFAPDRYVLSAVYQEKGLDFFIACREKIELGVAELPAWIRAAATDEKKGHSLRYLMAGEYGQKTAERLRHQGLHGTWLEGLTAHSVCFNGWEMEEIEEILFRGLKSREELKEALSEYRDWPSPNGDSNEQDEEKYLKNLLYGKDTQTVLAKIYAWWLKEKDSYLKEYEKNLYPQTFTCHFEEDEFGQRDRKSWLTLFMLAHFHTLGRQRSVQHKGFIDMCEQQGWWKIFADKAPETKSDKWMGVLEEYIEDQVDDEEYRQWMNRFLVIYKFARYMDDYQEAFLSIDRTPDFSQLSTILKPKTNPNFQGGGISAPPIEKTLGIGACFVVRELRRKEILVAPQVVPFCYLPVGRVRNLCSALGCRDIEGSGIPNHSPNIYQFLCTHLGEDHADFLNCYDIPLQIVTDEQCNILKKILN